MNEPTNNSINNIFPSLIRYWNCPSLNFRLQYNAIIPKDLEAMKDFKPT